jgi:HlyD family secretion protein
LALRQGSRLFRKQALDRLQSPERLDKLMTVVNLSDWIPLTALGVMALLAILWSIVGRIPVTVSGNSALIYGCIRANW